MQTLLTKDRSRAPVNPEWSAALIWEGGLPRDQVTGLGVLPRHLTPLTSL